jgi:hypothetical protein
VIKDIRERFRNTLSEEEYGGVMCQKIVSSSRMDNGTRSLTVWIAPSQGYAVRKIDYEAERTDIKKTKILSKEKTLVEIDVKQHQPDGIWFPSHWKLITHNENGLRAEHEVTVDVISLNEPIDPELFSLSNISLLRKGTPVSWLLSSAPPAKTGRLIWDGKNVVPVGEYHAVEH